MDPDAELLARAIAAVLNVDVQMIIDDIEDRKARAKARREAKNQRYDEALLAMTAPQAKRIAELQQAGAERQARIRRHRGSGNIAVFLQKTMWNSEKSRMCVKLYAVYPDGTSSETFERTLSVREDF